MNFYNMQFTAERAVKLLFKLFLEILDEEKVENEENQKNLEKTFLELEDFLKNCKVGKVYVTAFPDMSEFKKHTNKIAWETEVWLMEVPDHMIHFNGDRFMGPR